MKICFELEHTGLGWHRCDLARIRDRVHLCSLPDPDVVPVSCSYRKPPRDLTLLDWLELPNDEVNNGTV